MSRFYLELISYKGEMGCMIIHFVDGLRYIVKIPVLVIYELISYVTQKCDNSL